MDEEIEEAIVFGLSNLGYQSLRETQRKVIEAYLKGKDVFLCSPTGSGKSLCFEIAPYAIDFMKYDVTAVTMQNITKTVCVVIAPLVSLMKDQVSSLHRKGVSAICIGPESTAIDIEDIKSGKYNLVFGSPEALLNSYRYIFRGNMKSLLGAVFVDESHCIEKW